MNAGGHGSDMAASSGWRALARSPDNVVERGSLPSSCDCDSVAATSATIRSLSTRNCCCSTATPRLLKQRLSEIVRWRREHQPGGQNAGSVFVNPIPGELAAAELIDKLELRGFRIGGASVSEKHANFIQASESCTAADVRAVIEHVRAEVRRETGIELRSEVTLVGFEGTPLSERP